MPLVATSFREDVFSNVGGSAGGIAAIAAGVSGQKDSGSIIKNLIATGGWCRFVLRVELLKGSGVVHTRPVKGSRRIEPDIGGALCKETAST